MRIGIIGAGMIGSTVGRLFAAAGHEVKFATRHPEQLAGLVTEIGANASAGSVEEAVGFADVVLVSVPLRAWPELAVEIGSRLTGKVVIDTSNPYPGRDGALAQEVVDVGGTGVYLGKLLPAARLVRAFNTVHYKTLRSEAHRSGERLGIPIAGDDRAALDLVAGLARDAGFEAVIVGPLRDASRFDVGTAVYNKPLPASEVKGALGV
jgi:predicted dinucleotide-binding enzyme